MSGIRRIWRAIGDLGANRWWWTFWAAFVGAQVVVWPSAYLAILTAVYAAFAGWWWRSEIEKRHRRPPAGYARIETLIREDDAKELLGEWRGRRG